MKFVTSGLTIWPLFILKFIRMRRLLIVRLSTIFNSFNIMTNPIAIISTTKTSSTTTSPNTFSTTIFNGIDIFVNFWWYGKFQGRSPSYLELFISRSDPARSYRHFPCPKIHKKKFVLFFLIAIKNYINWQNFIKN